MAYIKDTWTFPDSNEYEYKFLGKYGAAGEKRSTRKRITREQIEKQNQRNREKKMRRLIKANFREGDFWVTLLYPKGTRKKIEEVKKDLQKFLRRLRRQYAKSDDELKFVYRIEIGSKGGIHIHILVNRSQGHDPDKIIQKAWEEGRASFESLRQSGGFKNLAEYITKKPKEEIKKQLSFFDEEDRKQLIKVSSSRNLVRPKPTRKKYSRWTMRKLIDEGPKPTKGFYIDKNSIVFGVNPYTGRSYLHYTEYRIRGEDDENSQSLY